MSEELRAGIGTGSSTIVPNMMESTSTNPKVTQESIPVAGSTSEIVQDSIENQIQELEDEDPLGIKQLALSYDYLVYRINDYIQNLSEQTYESVAHKSKLIQQDYLETQLNLSKEMEEIDQLLVKCNDIELEFMKLDQLSIFIEDFKQRLDKLEGEFTT